MEYLYVELPTGRGATIEQQISAELNALLAEGWQVEQMAARTLVGVGFLLRR